MVGSLAELDDDGLAFGAKREFCLVERGWSKVAGGIVAEPVGLDGHADGVGVEFLVAIHVVDHGDRIVAQGQVGECDLDPPLPVRWLC